MARTIQGLRWVLFGVYVVAGALALMIATPMGLKMLGLANASVTFLPTQVLGLPWTLSMVAFPDGPVATLAMAGIAYGLNIGIGLMLARSAE